MASLTAAQSSDRFDSDSPIRLAITSSYAEATTETFIRTQERMLPCHLRLFGWPHDPSTDPGGAFLLGQSRSSFSAKISRHLLPHSGVFQVHQQQLSLRLKACGITHVLANYGSTAVDLMGVCESNGLPLIAHFHGNDAHAVAVVERLADRYRQLGSRAHAIIAVSAHMRDALAKIGVSRDRMHLLRCSPELRPMRPQAMASPHEVTFLAVGRLVEKKAPYLTLLAFARVAEALPEARLVMIGDGPLRDVVQNLVVALRLDGRVELLGALANDRVEALLHSATAFVQHSVCPAYGPARGDCEGTPVAVQEAMVAGVPIVATRHAGIGEILQHEVSALLVDERDVRGMAEGMLRIVRDQALARRLAIRARVAAETELNAQQYARKLYAIIARSPAHTPNTSHEPSNVPDTRE